MAEIKNLQALIAKLRARAAKAVKDSDVSVAVGFTASYAIYVHENLEAKHPNGQAKFLEQPAREQADVIAGIVRTSLQRGNTMAQSLLLGGLRLQREAQLLCPVNTGNLKASAFTRLEKGQG